MSDHHAIEFLDFCRKFDQAMLVTHSLEGLIAISNRQAVETAI